MDNFWDLLDREKKLLAEHENAYLHLPDELANLCDSEPDISMYLPLSDHLGFSVPWNHLSDRVLEILAANSYQITSDRDAFDDRPRRIVRLRRDSDCIVVVINPEHEHATCKTVRVGTKEVSVFEVTCA